MTGDFSRWRFDPSENLGGILPQQGRVLTDADGQAQTRAAGHWQDTAARDTIGPDVAAVPAADANAFRVEHATVTGGKVQLTVAPGRAWADGLLAYLAGTPPIVRTAAYLQPPIQTPAATEATIGAGVRDAVVLEVWREAMNAFQDPDRLLEPALGGPDTAERILTAFDFRLYRMGPNDNCDTIVDNLRDNFANKGKLTVSLQKPKKIVSPCPVVQGGGYTGFEHNLYRIEIAATANNAAMFKYSRFNGGLVGTGTFDAVNKVVALTSNIQAITTSGLTSFYLEALQFDDAAGCWRVVYGAAATLNNTSLTLANSPVLGAIPATTDPVFIRLWDDIRDITAFPVPVSPAEPAELRDGIHLAFETPAAGKYTPGDYWTFPVRAGGIKNPETLIDAKPPEGIHYHRVPIAEIDWNAAKDVGLADIEDCRVTFQPLTRLTTCCTYRVGDGVHSHGDFKLVQDALKALPKEGGEICVLPGTYEENLMVAGRSNVRIHGCGPRSRIVSQGKGAPVVTVQDSTGITLDGLAIEADETGIGILVQGKLSSAPNFGATLDPPTGTSSARHIALRNLDVTASGAPGIQVINGLVVEIRECRVVMQDIRSTWPAVFFIGADSLIERNEFRVRSGRQKERVTDVPAPANAATGGLQLGGGCVRVRVIDNLIEGGVGNGITLGSITLLDANGDPGDRIIGWVVDADDPCNPCKPGGVIVIVVDGGDGGPPRPVSAGNLYRIRIERNRIRLMGLNGIGVIGFFSPSSKELIVVDGLEILGNDIRKCLLRPLAEIPTNMLAAAGYGAIQLGGVYRLSIWDNVIEHNGPNYLEPLCGIFVLHGEGVSIKRNRIVDNGARTREGTERAKAGARGGIVIVAALAPLQFVPFGDITFPRVQGTPALEVHDNVVSVQLGPALVAAAMGPVSVVANNFTSLGVAPAPGNFAVSTVLIVDLALPVELFGQMFTFQAIKDGSPGAQSGNPPPIDDFVTIRNPTSSTPADRWLTDGSVMFNSNHVFLDLLEPGGNRFLTSILILTLDDIQFEGNQCMANILQGLLLAQAILFGLSLRAVSNRFEEGLFSAVYSAVTAGFSNMTSQNSATHCLLTSGNARLLVNTPNNILVDAISPGACDRRNPGGANRG